MSLKIGKFIFCTLLVLNFMIVSRVTLSALTLGVMVEDDNGEVINKIFREERGVQEFEFDNKIAGKANVYVKVNDIPLIEDTQLFYQINKSIEMEEEKWQEIDFKQRILNENSDFEKKDEKVKAIFLLRNSQGNYFGKVQLTLPFEDGNYYIGVKLIPDSGNEILGILGSFEVEASLAKSVAEKSKSFDEKVNGIDYETTAQFENVGKIWNTLQKVELVDLSKIEKNVYVESIKGKIIEEIENE